MLTIHATRTNRSGDLLSPSPCGQSDCFSRSLHEYRDGAGKENHRCEQADRKQCEYNRCAADDGADLFRVLFPEITGDQDGDAHCELCHNKGDEV